MEEGIWELNRMEGKNPIHTGGFLTGYDQREFTPEEVCARESGQNTSDAGREVPGQTRLEFRELRLSGLAKDQFLTQFDFAGLFEGRLDAIRNDQKNQSFAENARRLLENEDLYLLLIRDFNTCGLGGAWSEYERGDHFARLVCALNLDDKADGDSASGGSYGLGKTAYAKSSAINTVIYHSVFPESSRTQGASRRLMAAGVYPRHDFDGHKWGGFAYFGCPDPRNSGVAKPFENDAALRLWASLSGSVGQDITRGPQEYGTDIVILMPTLELSKIKTAIEDYYFPAIIDGSLSVSFVDEAGNSQRPTVFDRPDLRQFIDLWREAKKGEAFSSETKEVASLNKHREKKLGVFAFEAAKDPVAESPRRNCVATMRGTGMVIGYVQMGMDQYEPAAGVFLADKEIHNFLIASENAAHSDWSEHSRKLETSYDGIGKEIVQRVNSALKRRFLQFRQRLQPDIVNSRTDNGLLSRLLSSALAGSKGDDRPDKDFHNPVSLHLTRKERAGDHSIWRLVIADNEYTPGEPFKLSVRPSISLAGDSKLIAIKHMEFAIKLQDGRLVKKGVKPTIDLDFERGMVLDYLIEFPNPGQHNYIVSCKCEGPKGVLIVGS